MLDYEALDFVIDKETAPIHFCSVTLLNAPGEQRRPALSTLLLAVGEHTPTVLASEWSRPLCTTLPGLSRS